jgi:hypothetical protein
VLQQASKLYLHMGQCRRILHAMGMACALPRSIMVPRCRIGPISSSHGEATVVEEVLTFM